MKRMLAVSLLALSLCPSVSAGDVPSPGKQDPPCTQNCSATTGETEPEPLPEIIIEIVLGLTTLLP